MSSGAKPIIDTVRGNGDKDGPRLPCRPEPALTSLDQRLKNEADFQNARVGAAEARDRFYYLVVPAFDRYDTELGDVSGKRVLVVGCSNVGVLPLARRGAHVIGIDVADEAVNQLNEAIAAEGLQARAIARVMNAEDLDVPPGSIDIIACSGVLHHLDVPRAAATFAKALAPDGRVVMMEPMAWNPPAAIYRRLTPSMRTEFEHPLVPRDVRYLRERFGDVRIEACALLSFLSLPFAYIPGLEPVARLLANLLLPVDRALFAAVPPLRYLAWTSVIVCRKPRRG